jgi:membrane peptidoglycan carboxypeptidase
MDFQRRTEPNLRFPSLQRALRRIHLDLFTVNSYVRRWIAYSPCGLTNLEKITILLEDRRFVHHHGFDLKSIVRELTRTFTFRRHGGASTIDMQFVRTCTGYKERTIARKLYEILLAVLIQFRYSKILILRSYLRCAFFGSRLYGADAAARKIFKKSADDLDVSEAAELAAMLVYPRPIVPTDRWNSRVKRRAEYGMRLYVRYKESLDKFPV